ncbi:MAG: NUDIX hydrolase [Bacteroidetes bacterium]|nr:NUDIX hydrolase [Bacteroidota bacterium]
MEKEVQTFYGNKIRVRVCGLCEVDNKILLVNHIGITKADFWAPPGGGLNFGETTQECLSRELLEETGLQIEVEGFLFACELIRPPLHAVELFFKVKSTTFQLKTGTDLEAGSPSIIKETRFMDWNEIQSISLDQLHGIFRYVSHPSKVAELRGYFKL